MKWRFRHRQEISAPKSNEVELKNVAEETHALLERLAQEQEQVALQKKDALLADAWAEYKRDLAGLEFKCESWGSFLTIFIARRGNPEPEEEPYVWTEPKEFSTALNLKNCRVVELSKGHVPDCLGQLSYLYCIKEGSSSWGSNHMGNAPLKEGQKWVVWPKWPYVPRGRKLFYLAEPEKDRGEYVNFDTSYFIRHRTHNYVRPAKDDEIIFRGLGATIYVPAGKGVDVYKQILTATK